jgi:hypothetical protein
MSLLLSLYRHLPLKYHLLDSLHLSGQDQKSLRHRSFRLHSLGLQMVMAKEKEMVTLEVTATAARFLVESV